MNIALDGESPYDNHDLFRYLQRHMSVMKSTSMTPWRFYVSTEGRGEQYGGLVASANSMFYTTDGMRFEFLSSSSACKKDNTDYYEHPNNSPLHESQIKPHLCTTIKSGEINENFKCGSYGLANNPNNLTATPCMIMVDVNGDRKPYPANVNCLDNACAQSTNKIIQPSPNAKKIKDTFSILITEDMAIPFGVAAQRAMYQAQK